jgi:hypothetical protein
MAYRVFGMKKDVLRNSFFVVAIGNRAVALGILGMIVAINFITRFLAFQQSMLNSVSRKEGI